MSKKLWCVYTVIIARLARLFVNLEEVFNRIGVEPITGLDVKLFYLWIVIYAAVEIIM